MRKKKILKYFIGFNFFSCNLQILLFHIKYNLYNSFFCKIARYSQVAADNKIHLNNFLVQR